MKIRARTVSSQLQKLDALETESDYRAFFSVFVTFIPDTTLGYQHFGVFGGETIQARTTQPILTFDEKPQRHRQLAKGFLIGFHRRQSRRQIAFAVSSAAS